MTVNSEQFMQQAIELARLGEGRTAPNPPVGAVVVRDGEIVGRGYHPAAGQPHAEIFALKEAGEQARDADLYVTLEPCCHQGRTGPCTEAIVASGIRQVYVGSQDPNPLVAGQGIKFLLDSGVKVEHGVLRDQCDRLILPFSKHITTGLPYVVYKSAITLDGQTASSTGDSRWISCEESRRQVHELRNRVDAIMVGSGTVLADNPQLTTRMIDGGRDPVRVIVDGALKTSPEAKVYNQSSAAHTVLATATRWPEARLEQYKRPGVELLRVDSVDAGLDLLALMYELGRKGVQSVLLEGGGSLASAMLQAGLIDRLMIFVAPKILGGVGKGLFAGRGAEAISESCRLAGITARQVGSDILIEGEVQDVYRPD